MYKDVVKRKVDSEQFKLYAESRGYSIRKLGRQDELGVDERTIRRILKEGEATVTLLYALCVFLECDMETLCGPDESYIWQDFQRRVM